MIERIHGGLPLLHFELFERFGELACAVSTRRGPGGAQFDLGPVRGPDRGANSAKWRRLADALGLAGIAPQLQVHGRDVLRVDRQPGDFKSTPEADASFTAAAGLGLLAFSADCPLVAVYQPGRAVGVAHASWRCTTGLIVRRLIERMVGELDCRPGQMWAAISPSAGPCCYEVGEDVYEAAKSLPDRDACFRSAATRRGAGSSGKRHFDLWQAARQQLLAAGLPPGQIETAGLCTICRNDLFFSFRREGPGVGSFGLMIGRLAREVVHDRPDGLPER